MNISTIYHEVINLKTNTTTNIGNSQFSTRLFVLWGEVQLVNGGSMILDKSGGMGLNQISDIRPPKNQISDIKPLSKLNIRYLTPPPPHKIKYQIFDP